MPHHVSTSNQRVDSYVVQHGDSESYRISTTEYVVLRKEWRGSQLLRVVAIQRYTDTPAGARDAHAHAERLQKERGG